MSLKAGDDFLFTTRYAAGWDTWSIRSVENKQSTYGLHLLLSGLNVISPEGHDDGDWQMQRWEGSGQDKTSDKLEQDHSSFEGGRAERDTREVTHSEDFKLLFYNLTLVCPSFTQLTQNLWCWYHNVTLNWTTTGEGPTVCRWRPINNVQLSCCVEEEEEETTLVFLT